MTIPAGSQEYETTVSTTENGQTIDVQVDAGINTQTGLVTATLRTIDPQTGVAPVPSIGFLPPENGTGQGTGYFSFTVIPQSGLATGTQIPNVAEVTFDHNQPVATDLKNDENLALGIDPSKEAVVTIDSGAPSSSVLPLPAVENSSSFVVQWAGQDDSGGSGIKSYEVYVSADGGPYTLFQQDTTATSAVFTGTAGHTYGFYSVATDNVGNVQPIPQKAQATTDVVPAVSSATEDSGAAESSLVVEPANQKPSSLASHALVSGPTAQDSLDVLATPNPQLAISGPPKPIVLGTQVSFSIGVANPAPEQQRKPLLLSVSFGDGTSKTVPVNGMTVIDHVYNQPGKYTVIATAINPPGKSIGSAMEQVDVLPSTVATDLHGRRKELGLE